MPLARSLISFGVPLLLWGWLFHHLHFEWTLNPQYHYGWAVPFLALFLLHSRWQTRPRPDPPAITARRVLTSLGLLSLLLFFPLRVVEEANPDWRLLSWTFALVVLLYTVTLFLRAGGTIWAKHFAFPLVFPLVSVPWPVQIENGVVQALTRAVAAVAVEFAGWFGIGALQLGNVIELRNGFVGVDEACSGVKTLQAAITVSLFLGEILALTGARRTVLLLAGCAWMFVCNIVRATSLVIVAARQGHEALAQWHDSIGSAVLVLGLGGLLALAWQLSRKAAPPAKAAPSEFSRFRPGVLETALGLAALGAAFTLTELWYRKHEQQLIARPAWKVEWPKNSTSLPKLVEDVQPILRYDSATSAAWQTPPGNRWWGFYARWQPRRTAQQLVRSHSPEICLPAAGRQFTGRLPDLVFDKSELRLSFRTYRFEQQGEPLFVFVCIAEDKTSSTESTTAWNTSGRLRAAWNGKRNLGQRLLELAVTGEADYETAQEALRRDLITIIVPVTG